MILIIVEVVRNVVSINIHRYDLEGFSVTRIARKELDYIPIKSKAQKILNDYLKKWVYYSVYRSIFLAAISEAKAMGSQVSAIGGA